MSRRVAPIDLSYSLVVGALAPIAIFILVGPVLIVLITSFPDNRSLKFPPTGFSLEWYAELFDAARSRQIHPAAGNSLEEALWGAALGALIRHGAAPRRRSRLRVADGSGRACSTRCSCRR